MKMRKWIVKVIGILSMILFFCSQNQAYVYASNIDETVETQQIEAEDTTDSIEVNPLVEEVMEEVLALNPEDATDPLTEKPEYEETTYTKDVTFSQATLKGIYSSTEIYFYIPEYWETEYVYAEIQYDLSQLIEDVVSSMTFLVNGVPIESCKISYDQGNTQIAYVKVPMDLLQEGYNSFSIYTYARLFDEEGCIDDFSGANWCSIADASYVRCGYEVKDDENKISYYPYPYMSTIEDTGKGLTIAVSDEASNGELEAAMNIMANLSSYTGEENNIEFCLFSDLEATNPERTIIISNYNNLRGDYKNELSGEMVDGEHALVKIMDDVDGNPLLMITSLSDECLLEAAYMLMDEERVSQEKTSMAIVNQGSSDVISNSTTSSQMVSGNYTLEDIMGGGLAFYGPFQQEQNIYLPFSEDYFLSDAGRLSLKFRYSENLDFTRSMITVYWGNIPIASKKLEKEAATGDTLTFAMPTDVVGTTAGSIRIVFDLEIQDLICSPRQDEMPWAYVSEESTFFLPASTGIVLTFDLKPSPFRTDGKFNNLMLVVPEEPRTEDLNLLAQVIGMYGEGVDPYGTFYVRRQSEFKETDADYNIITIGTYENNILIQKLNEYLYFAYNEERDGFVSNEQLILSDVYASDIAIFQLMESPYALNRGILAITGANEETLSYVHDFMRDQEKRYSLSKDCVILDGDLATKSFQFIEELDETEQPSMLVVLANNTQSLLFTVIATSVMLMILIAVIIILIRVRMYHKNNEDDVQ